MLRAALVALILAGCSAGAADVARDDDGRPTEAGTVRPDRIRVGDCFVDPADDGNVDGFPVVPCGEPHDNEVFHLYDVEGDGGYPGRDVLETQSGERCEGEPFETYVGSSVRESPYEVFQVVPSPESWKRGDRTVVCALYDGGLSDLRGSARRSTA